jgi:hypothetical protein
VVYSNKVFIVRLLITAFSGFQSSDEILNCVGCVGQYCLVISHNLRS